jgi:hypothetical protein
MFFPAVLRIAAIGVIVGATATTAAAQVASQPVPPQAFQVAQRSLAGLPSFVTPETFLALGFESVEEVNRAQIEQPMPIFMVRLDGLRRYSPGQNPADLLVQTNEVRFPISVDGQVRSSLTLRLTNGGWEVARVGRPQLTSRLVEIMQPPGLATQIPSGAFFEVSIPALNLEFVGRRQGSSILLVSVVSEPRYDLQAGVAIDAGQVFERLAPFAQQLETGPLLAE